MTFSTVYKQAEDVPVTLAVDFEFLGKMEFKQYKRPEEIFKYSLDLEQRIVSEYTKRHPSTSAQKPSFDSVLQPTPASKSPPPPPAVAGPVSVPKPAHIEFEDSAPNTPWDAPSSVKDDIDELNKALGKSRLDGPATQSLDAGLDVADHALQGESEEAKRCYREAAALARKKGLTDIDALRGFFMFKDAPQRIVRYVENFALLRDLGFKDDDIDQALLLTQNDQEKALEVLMENSK